MATRVMAKSLYILTVWVCLAIYWKVVIISGRRLVSFHVRGAICNLISGGRRASL